MDEYITIGGLVAILGIFGALDYFSRRNFKSSDKWHDNWVNKAYERIKATLDSQSVVERRKTISALETSAAILGEEDIEELRKHYCW